MKNRENPHFKISYIFAQLSFLGCESAHCTCSVQERVCQWAAANIWTEIFSSCTSSGKTQKKVTINKSKQKRKRTVAKHAFDRVPFTQKYTILQLIVSGVSGSLSQLLQGLGRVAHWTNLQWTAEPHREQVVVCLYNNLLCCTRAYDQFRVPNSTHLQIFGLWEEIGEPGVTPHRHRENM